MRVAFISADSGVPVFGCKGCSIHAQEIIRALLAHGADVHLFASNLGGKPLPGLEKVHTMALPYKNEQSSEMHERMSLAMNCDLRSVLEQSSPFDLIYERYSLWSFAGMEYARATGVPGVLEVNSPLIEEQGKYRKLMNCAGAERVAQKVFLDAEILLAVSNGVADYLYRFQNTRDRVHIVANGVNPDRFPENLVPSYPNEHGAFTIGFVGSLKLWHGLVHLVEAFALIHQRVPNSRLLIVGDGPEKKNLERELSTRNLGRAVHFTGAVAPDDVPGWLASMDIAVAPYPPQDHFYFSPLKIYEYMAAGLPVVASRIGELAELIEDGENGMLCPPGDAQALAAAIYRLSCDRQFCARLGRAARATVLPHYSWEQIVRRILQLVGLKRLFLYKKHLRQLNGPA
ncbi:MAG: glycosyltransferase family 4 protein [bacterium]